MGVPHDTPFVYRFDTPADRIYGPRPLAWVLATYGGRPECECAPADSNGTHAAGRWMTVAAWGAEMAPPPATVRQHSRLAALAIPHDPGTITQAEAGQLIRDATARLPPTKTQLANARSLGIQVPPGVTRGDVDEMIDVAERQRAIAALRRDDVAIAGDVSWDEIRAAEARLEEREDAIPRATALLRRGVAAADDMPLETLDELESARGDLDDGLRAARRIGFAFRPPPAMTLEVMQSLYAALCELEQHLGSSEASLDWLVERGEIPRKPRRAAIKAALPKLFERVCARTWQGSDEDDIWFFRRALELDG